MTAIASTPARAVADAVLFEGYVLYPYRASAPKNQVRWQWGVLFPPAFAEADGSERSRIRTECVVDPGSSASVDVRVRGLQVQRRSVEAILGEHGGRDLVPVSELDVDGVRWVPWDEAVEREIDLPPVTLLPLASARYEERVLVPGGDDVEELRSAAGVLCGRLRPATASRSSSSCASPPSGPTVPARWSRSRWWSRTCPTRPPRLAARRRPSVAR